MMEIGKRKEKRKEKKIKEEKKKELLKKEIFEDLKVLWKEFFNKKSLYNK